MSETTRTVRIAARRDEAQGICSFEPVGAAGGALPPFTAGAHVDVQLPGGPVRPCSLCNDPRETHRYLLGVLREPASRGGSAGMHALRGGDVLRIQAPRNPFALAAGARRSLLFAGGIGITPIDDGPAAQQLDAAAAIGPPGPGAHLPGAHLPGAHLYVCGTCLTRVIDGTPEHRDLFLTDEGHARNDCFTPCCSRAKPARLVLDL